jgi:uncharacterized protein
MKKRTMRALSISAVSLATATAAVGSSACSSKSPDEVTYVMGPVGGGGGSVTATGGSSSAGATSTGGSGGVAGSSGGSQSTAGGAASGGTGGVAAGGTGGTGGTGGAATVAKGHFKMLVYHETRGYHHDSIADGMQMLTAMAAENDFEITESDGDQTAVMNDPQITAEDLAPFDMIFFMSPTGDIFGAADSAERDVFKAFLKEKKSFAGVHATTDTEYTFTWYEDLVGEIYDGHALENPLPSGTINIEESQKNHPAMMGIASPWTRNEEWYKFLNRIDSGLPGLTILMRYGGGASATGPAVGQPLAWTRCWEGIRSFYTAMGHASSAYTEPLVKQHILGGILWAARRVDAPNETCL